MIETRKLIIPLLLSIPNHRQPSNEFETNMKTPGAGVLLIGIFN